MTSKEIFENEQGNTEQIRLYAEGLFWKAYERSAYACCTQLRGFKPTKKYIKAMDGEIVSIGFPQTSLSTLVDEEQIVERGEKSVVIKCMEPIDEKMFVVWKNHLPLTASAVSAKKVSPADSSDPLIPDCSEESSPVDTASPSPRMAADEHPSYASAVVERIRSYNLAEHTPMETMLFVSELKRLLDEH